MEAARTRARRSDPFHEGQEAARARRLRSVALAAGLVAFVALVFAVTMLKLKLNAHG